MLKRVNPQCELGGASYDSTHAGDEVEEVVDIVEDTICERYGRSSIQAKMQGIVFKAYRPIEG